MATTWNPSDLASGTLSNGNLTVGSWSNAGGVRSIASVTTGKYYFELSFAATGSATIVGIANSAATLSSVAASGTSAAICANSGGIAINGTGQTGVGAFTAGAACCIAVDMGAVLVWFRNGAAGQWNGSGTANPATGTGGYSFSTLTGGASTIYALAAVTSSAVSGVTANFGATPPPSFVGAVPSGFVAGFPTPTVAQLTQIGLEQWARGSPAAQLTQVAIEQWATLAMAPPVGRAYMISASRAGLPSATVWSTTTRSNMLPLSVALYEANVPAPIGPVGGATQARVLVLA